MDDIKDTIKVVFPLIEKELEKFQTSIAGILVDFQNKRIEENKELYFNLTAIGWIMDSEMPYGNLSKLIELADYDKIDTIFATHFRKRLKDIEKDILIKYPNRKLFIKSAFNAHKKKLFELSIPLMLTQTDGICNELTDKDLFSKQDKHSTNAWIIQLKIDSFLRTLLEPIDKHPALVANIADSKVYPRAINRNSILHGQNLDYANKINSFKTISLLNYVSTIIYDLNKKLTGGNII